MYTSDVDLLQANLTTCRSTLTHSDSTRHRTGLRKQRRFSVFNSFSSEAAGVTTARQPAAKKGEGGESSEDEEMDAALGRCRASIHSHIHTCLSLSLALCLSLSSLFLLHFCASAYLSVSLVVFLVSVCRPRLSSPVLLTC